MKISFFLNRYYRGATFVEYKYHLYIITVIYMYDHINQYFHDVPVLYIE